LYFTASNDIDIVSLDEVFETIGFPGLCKNTQTVPIFEHKPNPASWLVLRQEALSTILQ
jgi:hypothetical protein